MLARVIITARLPLATPILRTPLLSSLPYRRGVQTFNSSSSGGKWSKLLDNKIIQFGMWFTGVMASIAIVSGNAQSHRYLFSSESTGKSRALSLNEMENLTQNKAGEKKKDKKGIEEIMSDLYTEHIENKNLDDWDNVRTPRPEEPELYEEQQVMQATRLIQQQGRTKFTDADYVKITEADTILDLEQGDGFEE